MAHQCVHCSAVYGNGSKELLEGCPCGSHFFFYIKESQIEKIKKSETPINLSEDEKKKIEKDVREIMDIEEDEMPVILDLESVKISGPGKFEIDLVNLFNIQRPIVYKLEEGKYVIDIASTIKTQNKEMKKNE